MRGVLAGAVAMAVLGALPAAAQDIWDREDEVGRVPVLHAAPVPPAVAMHRCLALPWGGVAPRLGSCTVDEWRELTPVRGERFFTATYARLSITPATPKEKADTLRLGEVVLFSRPPGAPGVTPVLHWFYFRSMYGSVDVQAVAATEGRVLLAVAPCWNGTGGCMSEPLVRVGTRWVALADAWFASLPATLRARALHGTYVDLAAMTASVPLYSPRDANCCPSHELRARLALEGTRLVLRGYRIVPSRS